ncbi:MAG TPA: oligosaccharide flippase family protein [Chitinophagaceae bacterium]|nr:oligosaccharide flippase family protein [Chitinophagaceae bacterium]
MKLNKAIVFNSFYRVLNIAVSFAITVLLARILKAEGFGILSLLIANVTILNLFTGFGSDSGITYQLASGQLLLGKINTIIFSVLLLQLVFVLIVETVVHYITGHYWLYNQYLWVGLIYFFVVSVQEKYSALYYGHHLNVTINKIFFFSNLAVLAFFLWLYFGVEIKELVFYIKVYIGLCLVQTLLPVILFYIITNQKPGFSIVGANDLKLFFSYSIIAFITNGIQFLAYRIDYWFVDYYRGKEQLGIYVLSVKLSQLFWVMPVLFASIIFPLVAKDKINYNEDKMLFLIRSMNVFNLVMAIAACASASWLISFFFGEEYRNLLYPYFLLLPGVILFCIATILAAFFAGKNQLKVNLVASVLCFLIILFLDLWLIPAYGIVGAALASCIGYAVAALFYVRVYTKGSGKGINDIFLFTKADWRKANQLVKELFVKN